MGAPERQCGEIPTPSTVPRPSLFITCKLASLVQKFKFRLQEKVNLRNGEQKVDHCGALYRGGLRSRALSDLQRIHVPSHHATSKANCAAALRLPERARLVDGLIDELDQQTTTRGQSIVDVASDQSLFLSHMQDGPIEAYTQDATHSQAAYAYDMTCALIDRLEEVWNHRSAVDLTADSKWLHDPTLVANLLHLLQRFRYVLLMTLIHKSLQSLDEIAGRWHNLWSQKRKIKDGWFSEWPEGRRPLSTTWPWNIRPSLVVLWGVCWMFYSPIGSPIEGNNVNPFDFEENANPRVPFRHIITNDAFREIFPDQGEELPAGTLDPGTLDIDDSILLPDLYAGDYAGTPQMPSFSQPGIMSMTNEAEAQPQYLLSNHNNEVTLPPHVPGNAAFHWQSTLAYNNGQQPDLLQSSTTPNQAPVWPQYGDSFREQTWTAGSAYPNQQQNGLSLYYPVAGGFDAQGGRRAPTPHFTIQEENNSPHMLEEPPSANLFDSSFDPSQYPGLRSTLPTQYRHFPSSGYNPTYPPNNMVVSNDQGVSSSVDTVPVAPSPFPVDLTPRAEEVSPTNDEPKLDKYERPKRERKPQSDNGRYFCDVPDCNEKDRDEAKIKGFKRLSEWHKHMDVHERPYICPWAPTGKFKRTCKAEPFGWSGGITRHIREVHGQLLHENDEVEYCPIEECGRSRAKDGKPFGRWHNLKQHMTQQHPGAPIPPSPSKRKPKSATTSPQDKLLSYDDVAEQGDASAATLSPLSPMRNQLTDARGGNRQKRRRDEADVGEQAPKRQFQHATMPQRREYPGYGGITPSQANISGSFTQPQQADLLDRSRDDLQQRCYGVMPVTQSQPIVTRSF